MEAMETKSDVNPNSIFLGSALPKSFSWWRDVRMARNMIRAVTEKQRAINDEIAKSSNVIGFALSGMVFPGLVLVVELPPGALVELAKATVAMRMETTEQDVAVFVSHSPPVLTRPLWV